MRKYNIFLALTLLFLTTATTMASELKTVMLNVEKMTCSTCPITVKKALKKLDGVSEVTSKYEGDGKGWAKVTYNPSVVEVDDLTFATEMAGFPSNVKQ